MLFAVFTMSLGTSWCWQVQACSLLSQLMIWRSLHCMSWLSTAQKHTEISPQAKVGLCAHNTVEHYFFQVGIFALTPAMIAGMFSLDFGSRLPPQRVLVFIFFQTCIDFLSSCSAWQVMKVFHRAPVALWQPYCFLVLLVRGLPSSCCQVSAQGIQLGLVQDQKKRKLRVLNISREQFGKQQELQRVNRKWWCSEEGEGKRRCLGNEKHLLCLKLAHVCWRIKWKPAKVLKGDPCRLWKAWGCGHGMFSHAFMFCKFSRKKQSRRIFLRVEKKALEWGPKHKVWTEDRQGPFQGSQEYTSWYTLLEGNSWSNYLNGYEVVVGPGELGGCWGVPREERWCWGEGWSQQMQWCCAELAAGSSLPRLERWGSLRSPVVAACGWFPNPALLCLGKLFFP